MLTLPWLVKKVKRQRRLWLSLFTAQWFSDCNLNKQNTFMIGDQAFLASVNDLPASARKCALADEQQASLKRF